MNAIVRSSSSTIARGQLAGDDLAEDAVRVGHAGADPSASRQPAGVVERLLAAVQLARVLRRCELLQQLPHARAGGDAERARELVAAQQRRRRAVRAPAQGVGEQSAGERQVRLHRLVARDRPRGQAVGDRQQRHVDLDGRARAQVGEHGPRASGCG